LSISNESSNIIPASAIRSAINHAEDLQDAEGQYEGVDSGAAVTEGWANDEGERANPQVDFVSLERAALSLTPIEEVPEDQRKHYRYVAVFAWTFFSLAVVGILTFMGISFF
jgi:hypothetical protein